MKKTVIKKTEKQNNYKMTKQANKAFSLGSKKLHEGDFSSALDSWQKCYLSLTAIHEYKILTEYITTSWEIIHSAKGRNFIDFFKIFIDDYCTDVINTLEKINDSVLQKGKERTLVKINAPLAQACDKHGEFLFIIGTHTMARQDFGQATELFIKCAVTFDKYIRYIKNTQEPEAHLMIQAANMRQATCYAYALHCLNTRNITKLNVLYSNKIALLYKELKSFSTDNPYFSGLKASTTAAISAFSPASLLSPEQTNTLSLYKEKCQGLIALLNGLEIGEEGFEGITFSIILREARRAQTELQSLLDMNGISADLTKENGRVVLQLGEIAFRCAKPKSENNDFSDNYGALVALSKRHDTTISPLTEALFHFNVAYRQLNEDEFDSAHHSLENAKSALLICKNISYHAFTLLILKLQHSILENNTDEFIQLLKEARTIYPALLPNYNQHTHLIKASEVYFSTLSYALNIYYHLASINADTIRWSYLLLAKSAYQENRHYTNAIKNYYPDDILNNELFNHYSKELDHLIKNSSEHLKSDDSSLMSFREFQEHYLEQLEQEKIAIDNSISSQQSLENHIFTLDSHKSKIYFVIQQLKYLKKTNLNNTLKFKPSNEFESIKNLTLCSIKKHITELRKLIQTSEKLEFRIDTHYYRKSLEDPQFNLPERFNRRPLGIGVQHEGIIKRSNSVGNFFAFFNGDLITDRRNHPYEAPSRKNINPRL